MNMINVLQQFIDWTGSEVLKLEGKAPVREYDGPTLIKMTDDLVKAATLVQIFAGPDIALEIRKFMEALVPTGSVGLERYKAWTGAGSAMIRALFKAAKNELGIAEQVGATEEKSSRSVT
jgi:hypothetical protein